jgi:hypothetical protein
LALQVFRKPAEEWNMPAADRPARPLRRGFGVIAGLVAAADVAVAPAVDGHSLGIPTIPQEHQPQLLGYAAIRLVMAIWAVATSCAKEAKAERIAVVELDPSSPDESMERTVIHALRERGWYIADDVQLPHVDVDHIAVGPAGVLTVQIQWTNKPDTRGRPAARARIAAHQLRKALAAKELNVDVVPAILTFGPGLTEQPGGVRVVDAVAMLNGYQAEEWLNELSRRVLLPEAVVEGVRHVVADLREHTHVDLAQPALVNA